MQNATVEVGNREDFAKANCSLCSEAGFCSGLCVTGAGSKLANGGFVRSTAQIYIGAGQIGAGQIVSGRIPSGYMMAPVEPSQARTPSGYVIRMPGRKVTSPRYVLCEPGAAYLTDSLTDALQFLRERDAKAYAARHLDADIEWVFEPL